MICHLFQHGQEALSGASPEVSDETPHPDMTNPDWSALLDHQVVAALRPLPGHVLTQVDYGCFPYEVEMLASGSDRLLELDAEIRMQFGNDQVVFLSWCQSHDWITFNSLATSDQSFLRKNAVSYVDASTMALWKPCVGKTLSAIEVLGWQDTPALLRLQFGAASILAGVGDAQGFGNADALIVRPDEATWLFTGSPAEVLWRSTDTAAASRPGSAGI